MIMRMTSPEQSGVVAAGFASAVELDNQRWLGFLV